MEDRHLHMAYGTGGRVDKHEQKEKGKQTETKKSPEKREQTGGKRKSQGAGTDGGTGNQPRGPGFENGRPVLWRGAAALIGNNGGGKICGAYRKCQA